MTMRKEKAERYTIYVGLADRNEYEQKVSFEKASSLVSNVCRNYNMSFSSRADISITTDSLSMKQVWR